MHLRVADSLRPRWPLYYVVLHAVFLHGLPLDVFLLRDTDSIGLVVWRLGVASAVNIRFVVLLLRPAGSLRRVSLLVLLLRAVDSLRLAGLILNGFDGFLLTRLLLRDPSPNALLLGGGDSLRLTGLVLDGLDGLLLDGLLLDGSLLDGFIARETD